MINPAVVPSGRGPSVSPTGDIRNVTILNSQPVSDRKATGHWVFELDAHVSSIVGMLGCGLRLSKIRLGSKAGSTLVSIVGGVGQLIKKSGLTFGTTV